MFPLALFVSFPFVLIPLPSFSFAYGSCLIMLVASHSLFQMNPEPQNQDVRGAALTEARSNTDVLIVRHKQVNALIREANEILTCGNQGL